MKKRFVVAIDSMNKELDNKLLEYIKDNGFGWWHWIDNVWLLTTYKLDVSAVSIRNDLGYIIPNRKIVIEVHKSSAWAGYGPNTEEKNMFDWLHNTWTKDS